MIWTELQLRFCRNLNNKNFPLTRSVALASRWAWVVGLACLVSMSVRVAQTSALAEPPAGQFVDSTKTWTTKQRATLPHSRRSAVGVSRGYRLVQITPDSAHVGDVVRIFTSPQVDSSSLAVVTFGGRSAEVSFNNGNLLARIPMDLQANPSVRVNVEIAKVQVYPTGRLRVLPSPLRILSIAPNPAKHGDTLRITLQHPFPVSPEATWEAQFDSISTSVLAIDPSGLEISVIVPEEISAGSPTIVLRAGGKGSEPYFGFTLVPPSPPSPEIWTILLSALFGTALVYIAASAWARRRRRRAKPVVVSGMGQPISPEDATTYSLPRVPPDLTLACANNECVAYVGAGLSAVAGYPTWTPFVAGLLEWTVGKNLLSPELSDSLRRALQEGQAGPVADNIVNALRGHDGVLDEYLREIFVIPKSSVPATHVLIRKIEFSAVLTTNFDTLLEDALGTADTNVLTPADSPQLIEALSKRGFFILKLYGVLDRKGTVLVAPEQYLDAVARNAPFNQFMETLFFSRTMLFVGASLEGIEDYLKGINFREHRGKPHYALVNVRGTAWQAKAASLGRRYGIEVLPFTATEGFPEITSFLEELILSIDRSHTGSTSGDQGQRPTRSGSPLKRVRLENIGPFPELELELDPHLNIFLGDNGLGKSTILKAIAVGLCGKDAQPYAGRLIKAGESPSHEKITEAKILLETDRNQYLTQLLQHDGEADLTVRPGRPLEAEGWLAVGFPPLRNVSWRRPDAPKPQGKRIPAASDLLPLVKGDPDPRMDDLKQWLVDLDYMIARSEDTAQSNRYRALREEFFKTIDRLTPGVCVRYKGIDPITKQVTVLTDDGEVPIESVSQGTTSLISWIGVLLQRIYEVYGDESNPLERYALVLIDEIDAHMHPEWQRSLVGALTDIFPNIQFIATTHSPLIVAGLPAQQTICLRRNAESQVERIEIEDSASMGRADQILTGSLFNLQTTVDPITQGHMSEYKQLLGLRERTPGQQERFRELEGILQFRIPMSAETPPERRAQELVRAILRVQAGVEKFPDAERALMDKAEELLSAVSAARGARK